MGVPKKHKTRSGRDQRRSHHHLDKQSLAVCKNCNAPVRPHVVCSNCGHYKERSAKAAATQGGTAASVASAVTKDNTKK